MASNNLSCLPSFAIRANTAPVDIVFYNTPKYIRAKKECEKQYYLQRYICQLAKFSTFPELTNISLSNDGKQKSVKSLQVNRLIAITPDLSAMQPEPPPALSTLSDEKALCFLKAKYNSRDITVDELFSNEPFDEKERVMAELLWKSIATNGDLYLSDKLILEKLTKEDAPSSLSHYYGRVSKSQAFAGRIKDVTKHHHLVKEYHAKYPPNENGGGHNKIYYVVHYTTYNEMLIRALKSISNKWLNCYKSCVHLVDLYKKYCVSCVIPNSINGDGTISARTRLDAIAKYNNYDDITPRKLAEFLEFSENELAMINSYWNCVCHSNWLYLSSNLIRDFFNDPIITSEQFINQVLKTYLDEDEYKEVDKDHPAVRYSEVELDFHKLIPSRFFIITRDAYKNLLFMTRTPHSKEIRRIFIKIEGLANQLCLYEAIRTEHKTDQLVNDWCILTTMIVHAHELLTNQSDENKHKSMNGIPIMIKPYEKKEFFYVGTSEAHKKAGTSFMGKTDDCISRLRKYNGKRPDESHDEFIFQELVYNGLEIENDVRDELRKFLLRGKRDIFKLPEQTIIDSAKKAIAIQNVKYDKVNQQIVALAEQESQQPQEMPQESQVQTIIQPQEITEAEIKSTKIMLNAYIIDKYKKTGYSFDLHKDIEPDDENGRPMAYTIIWSEFIVHAENFLKKNLEKVTPLKKALKQLLEGISTIQLISGRTKHVVT